MSDNPLEMTPERQGRIDARAGRRKSITDGSA